MRAHRDAAYVHLIVNERREAGASLPHTHAQLYALDFVPAAVARERERFGAYATRTMGGNLLADLVQEEVRRRERIVAIDDEAVLMAPYAGRVPFQLLIAPRDPAPALRGRRPERAPRCSTTRSAAWRGGSGASPPLNLWVRTAPREAEHFCWRIDILPRLTHLAGLELGAGVTPQHRRRPSRRPPSCASSEACERSGPARVAGPSVSVEGAAGLADRPGAARAARRRGATDTERDADWLADKVRALRVFRRRRRPDERAARRARGPVREPVHPLRRRPARATARATSRPRRRSWPSRCTSASASASGPGAACSGR